MTKEKPDCLTSNYAGKIYYHSKMFSFSFLLKKEVQIQSENPERRGGEYKVSFIKIFDLLFLFVA